MPGTVPSTKLFLTPTLIIQLSLLYRWGNGDRRSLGIAAEGQGSGCEPAPVLLTHTLYGCTTGKEIVLLSSAVTAFPPRPPLLS